MITGILKYLGCISYKELMHGMTWQFLQGAIATIPPMDLESNSNSTTDSNKPVEFFDFGKKLMNLK